MMVEAYVSGVSQRKMGDVTEALMGERVGRWTVRVRSGSTRAFGVHPSNPYLYLDATSSMPAGPERSRT